MAMPVDRGTITGRAAVPQKGPKPGNQRNRPINTREQENGLNPALKKTGGVLSSFLSGSFMGIGASMLSSTLILPKQHMP
jgi:hypothetical protein